MIKNLLVTVCIFSCLLFLSQTANACLCFSFGSAESSFSSSEAVFTGKVIKIKKVKEAKVAILMKESGTLELLSEPRWEISKHKAQSVTMEVIESFKGATEKTFLLYSAVSSCGIRFKIGESFLVFAHKTQPSLSNEEAAQSKENWTIEMHLKAQADRDNGQLPPFTIKSCEKTGGLRFMNKEVEEIRIFLKNRVWKEKKQRQPPTRIIDF